MRLFSTLFLRCALKNNNLLFLFSSYYLNHNLHPIVILFLFVQNHPAFPDLLQALWDRGFTLCYKEKFRQAATIGSNVVTLDMRADMPGTSGHVETMMAFTEDLDQEQDHAPQCRCADTALTSSGESGALLPPAWPTSLRLSTSPRSIGCYRTGCPRQWNLSTVLPRVLPRVPTSAT